MRIRTYQELIRIPTFEERFEYLRLDGSVGVETFGYDRYLNQDFYQRSAEWKRVRAHVIARDYGKDLACDGYEIYGQKIYIHHMNPISIEDIIHSTDFLLDPDYLITTTHGTHNAIHYGDKSQLPLPPVERQPGDTCPWRR
ncbi:MAG: hypothetical protein LIP10_03520 [Clostridiales bacterium]|nr:hypothetical protein [Clostridiales bacterium]